MNAYWKKTIKVLIMAAAIFMTHLLVAYAYDDVQIGSESVKYVDPEIDSDANMITFRDAWLTGNAWAGWLDPATGDLVSETGQDFWLAGQLSPINELQDNGPEWLRHNGALMVIYTRQEGMVERMYLWSTVTGQSQPVMPGTDYISRTHFDGSNSADGSGKLLYRRRSLLFGSWEVYWLDLSNPTQEHRLPDVELDVSLPTWIENDTILYSRHHGDAIQLVQYDTATLSETVLTSDSGDKLGAYAWNAPEAGGDLLYMAAVKMEGDTYASEIRVYQMVAGATEPITFVTFAPPPEAGSHVNIASPEPFVYDGASYISLALFNDAKDEGSIWVFALPTERGGQPPAPQRLDDPNLAVLKLDPEWYVTPDGAYVYYYYNVSGWPSRVILHRCAFYPTGAASQGEGSGYPTHQEDEEATAFVLENRTAAESTLSAPQTQETKLIGSDAGIGDLYGWSVALDGDVAVVGAVYDDNNNDMSGAAYVFRRYGQTWVEEAKLTGSDVVFEDHQARMVAVNGDVILVPATYDNDNGYHAGAVYVFRWDGANWNEEAKLVASDGAAEDYFGYGVAVHGDLILVGAKGDDDNGVDAGSAYIFRWDGANWNEEAKLLASDGGAGDYFSFSVAVQDNVALLSAVYDDDQGTDSGSAYVFRWNGLAWDEEAKLMAEDGTAHDQFGWSVSLSNGVALIGADGVANQSGAAYIFRWDGADWNAEAKVTAEPLSANDQFGKSVSLDGDVALVGAYGTNSWTGAAYRFRLNGLQWVEEAVLTASDGKYLKQFGRWVALNGETALVGSPGLLRSMGAAYVYTEGAAAQDAR